MQITLDQSKVALLIETQQRLSDQILALQWTCEGLESWNACEKIEAPSENTTLEN